MWFVGDWGLCGSELDVPFGEAIGPRRRSWTIHRLPAVRRRSRPLGMTPSRSPRLGFCLGWLPCRHPSRRKIEVPPWRGWGHFRIWAVGCLDTCSCSCWTSCHQESPTADMPAGGHEWLCWLFQATASVVTFGSVHLCRGHEPVCPTAFSDGPLCNGLRSDLGFRQSAYFAGWRAGA
ncbi:hypothetical protein B0T11DRAFT_283229, partial [Plectosphaerella cucumerina]